jgi:nitrile hydratase
VAYKFKPGDTVRVRTGEPEGHCRTPYYLRGRPGVIDHRIGVFHNPEQLAHLLPADEIPLYQVRFAQTDLWDGYPPGNHDTLTADIFEHWLDSE